MKTIIAFGLVCLAWCGKLPAQSSDPSVVAAGGGIATGEQLQLEWTLGETAVASAATSRRLLTEGFHQPSLEVEPVVAAPFDPPKTTGSSPADAETKGASDFAFKATIFPNPVATELAVRFEGGEKFGGADLRLMSAGGSVLLARQLSPGEAAATLHLDHLPPGIYFLRCRSLDRLSTQTFKVTKI